MLVKNLIFYRSYVCFLQALYEKNMRLVNPSHIFLHLPVITRSFSDNSYRTLSK